MSTVAKPNAAQAPATKSNAVLSNLPNTIRVYNTLSKKKEPLETVVPGQVGIYLCGPTVYDRAHIGHMVGPVIFDAIKRYLVYCGYQVNWVVNITDVDDKLINKANERNISMPEVAEENIADYLGNLAALGVDQIDHMPRATDHMDEIIRFVEQLIERNFAYAVDGDVFFDVARDETYGKLSNRTADSQQGEGGGAAARKRSASDFALWKSAKPGEPSWDSPWGKGRPGWHIECSAMSRVLLGETFDFHGGGLDLVFPHHENEIAQSECCHGKPMARYWLHNGLMRADSAGKVGGKSDRDSAASEADAAGGKISRSKGGSTGESALAGLIERQGGERIRFFLLRTQYRSTIVFSEAAIEEAATGLDTFYRFFERYERITGKSFYSITANPWRTDGNLATGESELLAAVDKHRDAYLQKMDDDFNTGGATAELFELARVLNRFAEQHNLEDAASRNATHVKEFTLGVAVLRELSAVLGLFAAPPATAAAGNDALTGKLLDLMIELRQLCRAEKNFAMSDTIRDRLSELGVTLEDRKGGTGWRID